MKELLLPLPVAAPIQIRAASGGEFFSRLANRVVSNSFRHSDPPSRKPLVLLVPGLDGTGKLFYRHLDPLSARYRVQAWEFRRRTNFYYSDLVQELAEATATEERGSIVVVGESFGGTVAMHYVLSFPDRVRVLALINTFPYYHRRVRIGLACLLSPMLALKELQTVKNLVVDQILRWEGILPQDRREYRRIIQSVDPVAYRWRLELVRQLDLRPRLREITIPTILFASGRDKLVPSVDEACRMAASVANCTLHEFPRAGHALLLTPGFSLADYL